MISFSVQASMIHIGYEDQNFNKAKLVQNIFEKKYNIPKSLIKVFKQQKCQPRDPRFLFICINKKGELLQLSNINLNQIRKSLKVFKN
jgi:hypothetical protein|tara:strand:- start:40 stop:303 length:264 start_codon:yes stop_codon:yes gene_type:complete